MLDPPKQETEKLLTVREAAEQLGLPYWKLNRAVKQNLIPSYTLLNTRRLVKVSEILSSLRTYEKMDKNEESL